MLRRYSSRGLDGVNVRKKTVIGNSNECDIRLNVPGVAPVHATIEYHPLTRSYWLMDHSLFHTTVNGHALVGQVDSVWVTCELADGDLVRFGEAQPLVFQSDTLVPRGANGGHYMNGIEGRRLDANELPVIGKRIVPSAHNRRIVSGKARKKRSESADQITRTTYSSTDNSPSASIINAPSIAPPFSRLHTSTAKNRSVGNELLQRVVKLQGEVARRDEELRMIRASSARRISTPAIEESLLQARRENARLRELLLTNDSKIVNAEMTRPLPTPEFEHQIYKAFVFALAAELKRFSDKVLTKSAHDYSEVFSTFVHELDDPFSIRLLEIEAACEGQLADKGYDRAADKVRDIFRGNDSSEGIMGIFSHIESLWPVLRDGMSMARDSARACVVMGGWSRRLGEQIRVSGLTAERLLQSCDDLKSNFIDGRLSSHWLPPSLTPLLRTAALKMKEKEEEREKEAMKEVKDEKNSGEEEARVAEATAPLLQQLQSEREEIETIKAEKSQLSAALEHSQERLKQMEMRVDQLISVQEEFNIFREDRDREKTEYEERIKTLEEALRKAIEEKDALEEELVGEAERLRENVHQSVEKIRKKRSIRFAENGRPSSVESDTMSVVTPGMPIQRPQILPSPMTPMGTFPSPIFSLTDTENTEHALKMESIDEEDKNGDDHGDVHSTEEEHVHHTGDDHGEEDHDGVVGDDHEQVDKGNQYDDDHSGDGHGSVIDDDLEDEEGLAGDEQGDEQVGDHQSVDDDEETVHEEPGDEHQPEESEQHQTEDENGDLEHEDEAKVESSDEENDEADDEEEDKEKENVEEHTIEENEPDETNDQKGEDGHGSEGNTVDDHHVNDEHDAGTVATGTREVKEDVEGTDEERQELAKLREQFVRVHDLREKLQQRIAPNSHFTAIEEPIVHGITQQIYALNTAFRREVNVICGMLGLKSLSELESHRDNGDKDEGVDQESIDNQNSFEHRENILKELEIMMDKKEAQEQIGSQFVHLQEDRETHGQEIGINAISPDTDEDSGKASMDSAEIMKKLNASLLDRDDAPKNVNEVRFASHLQSHMNSAVSRPPTSNRTKLPIKVAQVSIPNGVIPHNQPPTIRQPRFKF